MQNAILLLRLYVAAGSLACCFETRRLGFEGPLCQASWKALMCLRFLHVFVPLPCPIEGGKCIFRMLSVNDAIPLRWVPNNALPTKAAVLIIGLIIEEYISLLCAIVKFILHGLQLELGNAGLLATAVWFGCRAGRSKGECVFSCPAGKPPQRTWPLTPN
jgi:hypothetical protein